MDIQEAIKNQYADELEHIAQTGKLPEWTQKKSTMVSFFFNQDLEGAWDDNGNVFLGTSHDYRHRYLPVKPVAENALVKVFAAAHNGGCKGYIFIFGKASGKWKYFEINASSIEFKLIGETVAVLTPSTEEDARTHWRFFSFDREYDRGRDVWRHMKHIEDIDYDGEKGLWLIKGLLRNKKSVDYHWFKIAGNRLEPLECYGDRPKTPTTKVEHVLCANDTKKVIPAKFWYDEGEIFSDTSCFA